MPREVLLPCSCGKTHHVADPGRNTRMRCKNSDKPLVYICRQGEGYKLRGKDKDVLLQGANLVVGRLSSCDLVLGRGQLSRKHCQFTLTDDGYALADLGSSNGTFVNDERLDANTATPLIPGDLVRIADMVFRYIGPVEETEPLPPVKPTAPAKKDSAAPVNETATEEEEGGGDAFPDDALVGKNLGQFMVRKVMSQGGMGRVYLGKENTTGAKCVIKTIIPEQAMSEKLIDRFLREIDLSERLVHPNIVRFLGMGQVKEILYYALEFFEGKDLRHWFAKKPASIKAAIRIGTQICDGLAVAHAADVIHRDIKPENILMDRKAHVKIIDFGIAKALSDPEYTSITVSGAAIGTPRYMPPEQIAGEPKKISPATDVFAVGGVIYYLLTCRPPREGKRFVDIIRNVDTPPVPPAKSRQDLPDFLNDAIMTALSPEASDRFQSMVELKAALQRG